MLGGANDTHFIQTSVHCRGKPKKSCFEAAHDGASCDLSSDRCPCDFHMPRLPPLDFEYNFIAKIGAARCAEGARW